MVHDDPLQMLLRCKILISRFILLSTIALLGSYYLYTLHKLLDAYMHLVMCYYEDWLYQLAFWMVDTILHD